MLLVPLLQTAERAIQAGQGVDLALIEQLLLLQQPALDLTLTVRRYRRAVVGVVSTDHTCVMQFTEMVF